MRSLEEHRKEMLIAWICKCQRRSWSNSIYPCFPLPGFSQCHFTSDVAESAVLNGQGYAKPHVWETFFLPMLWFLEQIFISSKPNPCHIYDRAWLGFEGTDFLEKGSFIWETSGLTQQPRRNVQSYGPCGPIYSVKGAERHKLAANPLVYPSTQGNVVIVIQISWDHGGFLAESLSKWTSAQSPFVLRNSRQSSSLATNKAHCNINLLFKLVTCS